MGSQWPYYDRFGKFLLWNIFRKLSRLYTFSGLSTIVVLKVRSFSRSKIIFWDLLEMQILASHSLTLHLVLGLMVQKLGARPTYLLTRLSGDSQQVKFENLSNTESYFVTQQFWDCYEMKYHEKCLFINWFDSNISPMRLINWWSTQSSLYQTNLKIWQKCIFINIKLYDMKCMM